MDYQRALADKRRESKAIFGIDYDCPKCVSFSLKNRSNVTLERRIRQVIIEKDTALLINWYID